MGKWADLPIELVECMEMYLDFVEKVRIRAVCASWNSHLPAVPKLISKDLPWLLLEDSSKGASLYNVHESKFYFLNLPELKHKLFRGSSCGWIITLEDEKSSRVDDIFAFNPLTRARIKFPPRSAFPDVQDYDPDRVGEEYIMKEPDYPVANADPDPEPDSDPEPEADPEPELEPEPESELESDPKSEREDDPISCKSWVNYSLIRKVVLSSSPSSNDCIAVAIYGEYLQLAWCRPHHNKWTSFYDYSCHRSHNGVADVIFYNGKLHALYNDGKLEIYETIDPQVTVQQVVAPHIENPSTLVLLSPLYLAVCPNLGIIYASRRIRSRYKDRVTTVDTEWIYLYNLVESSMKDGSKSWVELDGLGDNILFVGLNMSYSVFVSDEFKSLGYERNRAYFTDHYLWNRKSQDDSDMGLLDFDGSFTDGLPGFEVKPEFFWPPPIWVTPSAI